MRQLLLLIMLFSALPTWAAEAKAVGGNPVIEARMVKLAENLRCLVCQNESLAASQADLARDLRNDIRKQMEEGKTDKQVIAYLTHRYGDFVLYKPPLRSYTILLWFGPFAFLFVGASIWYVTLRRRKGFRPAEQVSAEAMKQAADLLENKS